ncbi:PAS domain-containing sensor histidine kinase [Mucilaginibacter panaciglaebae]|uniref:histidine kinase n=1 Tax=Mucilaginibacter panaciglaebae TaxID=502331 RepID=A0ABP7W8W6_9SPHI
MSARNKKIHDLEAEVRLLKAQIANTKALQLDKDQLELEYQHSQTRFRTIFDESVLGNKIIDSSLRIIKVNRALLSMLGYNEDQLIGHLMTEFAHPDVLKQWLTLQDELWALSRPSFNFDTCLIKADGSLMSCHVTTILIPDDSGTLGYTILEDITEAKDDERRKNDFINMVSHELKTPLTSSISYVQVSQRSAAKRGDEVTQGMMERTGKQLAKMAGMINGFLNLSRLESGKIQIDSQPFDLALLLGEAKADMQATFQTCQLNVDQVKETWVNADRDKIGQVINNLISNAVKYSAIGSTIDVVCAIVDGLAKISFSDPGIGIAEEDMPRLFERFFRVSNNGTKNISGFGIGLYLSYEIIKRHGGEIWADSTPGKGSTFHFSLPLATNPPTSPVSMYR